MKTRFLNSTKLSKLERRQMRDTALAFLNTRLNEMDALISGASFKNLHWKVNTHNERFLLWPISSTGMQSECFQFYVDENKNLVKVIYMFLQGLAGVTLDVTNQIDYSVTIQIMVASKRIVKKDFQNEKLGLDLNVKL